MPALGSATVHFEVAGVVLGEHIAHDGPCPKAWIPIYCFDDVLVCLWAERLHVFAAGRGNFLALVASLLYSFSSAFTVVPNSPVSMLLRLVLFRQYALPLDYSSNAAAYFDKVLMQLWRMSCPQNFLHI